MNGKPIFPVLAVVAIALASFLWGGSSQKPAAVDSDSLGAKLLSAFSKTDSKQLARRHAAMFAAVCDQVADVIEEDGKRPADKRLLKTGIHYDNLRLNLRVIATGGFSFKQEYPKLEDVLKEFLDAAVGKESADATDEYRDKWVKAYRRLADASQWAAKSL